MDLDEAARVFTQPAAYADEARFHAPRPALGPEIRDARRATDMPIRTLVRMDPRDHLQYRHVGFGFGAHYCLGTHLARLEAGAVPRAHPAPAVAAPAGPPAYKQTLFVGGPKHPPIRYEPSEE